MIEFEEDSYAEILRVASVNGQRACLKMLASCLKPYDLIKWRNVIKKDKDDFVWRSSVHINALSDNVYNPVIDMVYT